MSISSLSFPQEDIAREKHPAILIYERIYVMRVVKAPFRGLLHFSFLYIKKYYFLKQTPSRVRIFFLLS
jgi:hypothetical protein